MLSSLTINAVCSVALNHLATNENATTQLTILIQLQDGSLQEVPYVHIRAAKVSVQLLADFLQCTQSMKKDTFDIMGRLEAVKLAAEEEWKRLDAHAQVLASHKREMAIAGMPAKSVVAAALKDTPSSTAKMVKWMKV